jgi:hypothetical protein
VKLRPLDRRHLLAGLCAAVAVTLVAAVPGVLTSSGGGGRRVQAAAAPGTGEGPPSGTVSAPGDTTAQQPGAGSAVPTTPGQVRAQVLGVTFDRTSTTSVTPVIRPPAPSGVTTTTTAKPLCRNSTDPRCGSFRWDPDPGPNQPATGQLSWTQSTGTDHKVSFRVVANDPDANPIQTCHVSYGDSINEVCDPRPAVDPNFCPKQYGPWTPPTAQKGDVDTTIEHTYSQPGRYDVSFEVRSAMNDCNNPYASTATLTATVIVT